MRARAAATQGRPVAPTFPHRTRFRPAHAGYRPGAAAARPASLAVGRSHDRPLRPHAPARPEAPEERRTARDLARSEPIDEAGGELVAARLGPSRPTAYEIDHRARRGLPPVPVPRGQRSLERLDQRLSITDGVLRFRIIKLTAAPADPAAAGPAAGRRDDREPQDTKVAARAAADAPAVTRPGADAPPADAASVAVRRGAAG